MAYCPACGAALPPGARFCPACAAPVAEEAPGEERKRATVLFADLVGSTELADSQDAERTRALLNRFYDAMAEQIVETGGTIEKFIGDAVVAAFGAPVAQEDHADRALDAALSMQRTLRAIFGEVLKLRIGVNTGDVVVGQARAGGSFVTGDAVNMAARLEQAAAPGEILVGTRTVAVVRKRFVFGEVATVSAKGKAAGVSCRRLLEGAPGGTTRLGTLGRAFIGREPQLEALRAAYTAVSDTGRPGLVVVVGEPGLGKTTLVAELWGWLAGRAPEPLRRIGRCSSYGRGNAYWPLGEIVREHLGLRENDSPDTVRTKLGGDAILGMALGLEAPADLHPLAARNRLHDAWGAFLTGLAAAQPGVVLVEDVHWAQDDLLDALVSGFDAVSGPLLLLVTARPGILERDPAWAERGTLLRLDALSAAETNLLVDELVPAVLPPSIRSVVVERAEGNPFFAEELIGSFVDGGVLRLEDSGWVAEDLPPDFRVPDTVQALLAARIDLLPPRDKATLQAASVIGRTFWAGGVDALQEGDSSLRVLVERDLVRELGSFSMLGEQAYAFKHALTRDVAYESLTKASRLRLHAGFARWLERLGEGRDEHAPLLAHHYAEAVRPEDVDLAWPDADGEVVGLRERAVVWLRKAAALAIGRYEMRDAVSLLERAVVLEPETPRRVEIWKEIAHAHVLNYDGKAFAAALDEAIALCERGAAATDLYAELAFQTMARAGMWGTPPPANLVGNWIERTLEVAGPDSPARAKALVARCFSDYDKSPGDAAEASRIAGRLGEPLLRSYGYDVRGLVAFARGEYEESLDWARRRVSIAGELGDPDTEALVYAGAVSPAVACGELEEARAYAVRQDEVTKPLSAHHRMHGVSGVLELEEMVGNWSSVIELQERVEAAVDANVATPCVRNARSLLVCALAHAYRGEDGEARRLERAADEHAMTGYGTVLDTPRVELALHRGDLATVESLLGEPAVRTSNWFYLSSMAAHLDGLAALGEAGRVEAEAARELRPGTYLEPFALRALGIVRGDKELVERAAGLFEGLGLEWQAGRSRALA
ncbi:MAG TPA: adenylate/guanylate cyclase domain-containing protein [Gaiellaceae bacterium]|nr:adenylate/guanylate cyclase domain-containing protein [Gaiellaceae bacterium]